MVIGGVALLMDWSPGADPAWRRRCAGHGRAWARPRSPSLGLFVAGALRAEATLAVANLVYLLLAAGGAVVLPASYGYGGSPPSRRGSPRVRSAPACGSRCSSGPFPLPPGAGAARVGGRRHRPHGQDVQVGVTTVDAGRPPPTTPTRRAPVACAWRWASLAVNILIVRHRRRRPAHRQRARLPDLAALHRPVVHPARRDGHPRGDRVRQPDDHVPDRGGRDRDVGRRLAQSGAGGPRGSPLVLALGVPAQAVLGGITVLTDLNPWTVSLHLLLSMAMICVAVLLVQPGRRARRTGPRPTVPAWRALAGARRLRDGLGGALPRHGGDRERSARRRRRRAAQRPRPAGGQPAAHRPGVPAASV